jgi:PBSX family phage portal protein
LKALDPANGAVQPNAFEPEDEYQQLYVGATRDQGIIEPPFVPRTLERLSQENNALGPCIEAMVRNVDGTGYEFEAKDGSSHDGEDDASIERLEEFFKQPWPGVSFTTIRQLLRRDLERTGNAYLEVLRNPQDEIVFVRRVDAAMMRLLRLDDPAPVDQTVVRDGKEITIKVMTRERRYCQLVNGVSLVYFKDFGVRRDLNKKSAVWAPQGQRLAAKLRATEILHFTNLPDAHTPYGLPRWINQVPSVLGSRKAEEFNLEFFDNGGVPPIMIMLQGGTLQSETRRALTQMTSGEAKKNNRVQILEVEPSGGSLESIPQARVTVERFGAERQSDSMFEKYDQRCEERIRRAFRLPPIFVGQANDYSFATAFASYTLAEAQVFAPERDEFDEIISMRLLPAMGFGDYRLRSKPTTIEDATLKLQGIEVAMSTNQVEMEDVIGALNEATGTNLKVSERLKEQQIAQQDAAHEQAMNPPEPPQGRVSVDEEGNAMHTSPIGVVTPLNPGPLGAKGSGAPKRSQASKADGVTVAELALKAMTALRKRDFGELAWSLQIINRLDDHGRQTFHDAVAALTFVDPSLDPEGLAELSSCTMAILAGRHDHAH